MIRIVLAAFIILSSFNFAQQGQGPGGRISGRILDSLSSHSIEYANIVLYKVSDSTQVTGTVSDVEGNFLIDKIPPGNYYMDVLFIGYERARINSIQLTRGKMSIEMGDIFIHPASINLDEVVVEQDRPLLSYQIDKKVINVDQLSATISGTAAEVLENIPSVSVDIEGNVSVRGSSNFTVLIDGRPSIVDAQDLLQQIPASTIESIELITNPSAKYNPEGTAGIINIILKKNRNIGFSGVINATAGLNDKYGGDFLFQFRNSFFNSNFGFDYNDRVFTGSDDNENRYIYQGSTRTIQSFGDSRRGRESLGFRGSIEFDLGISNFITLGGRYNTRKMNRNADLNYIQWTNTSLQDSVARNSNYIERSGNSYSLNFTYLKRFELKGHELTTDWVLNNRDSEDFSVSEIFDEQNIIRSGRKTTEDGPSSEINARVDYVFPFSETNKVEAGYQGEIDVSDEVTTLMELPVDSSGNVTGGYVLLPFYSHDVRYKENEHAFYSTYSGGLNDFGYQLGLRAEQTDREIKLLSTSEDFIVKRWDFFPTFHTSYQFAPGKQLMASYTRRINRPRGWALEPFLTWFNANTVRSGNPSLLPEFIDSYEIGGQIYIGKVSVSAELYYLLTHNKIEGVRSVFAEDVTLQTFSNVGKDMALGTELMLNFNIWEFWDINLMGNVYDYRIEGVLYDEEFSRSSFNWRSRMNNVLKLGSNTQFQFNVMYQSPSVSSQGRRESYVSSDLAVRQDMFEKKLTLTFQVRNLFASSHHRFTSEGPGFYSQVNMQWESPIVMLNLRWNINSFKQDRKQQRNDEGFMDSDEI